ncbi:hypothetical protein [Dactylococcopsis salina]|uniref:hypothetical protein n=1 Tax=Dactylococcopsis salina TaxID=292566 RepID=UPI0002DEE7BF|nr:hypothetical protein [Dactylococcopsis salina]
MVIGYWLFVICYLLFVIGYWLFVIGYWLFVIGNHRKELDKRSEDVTGVTGVTRCFFLPISRLPYAWVSVMV